MAKGDKYYGVAKGHTVGVFTDLFVFPISLADDDRTSFEKSIKGYPGARGAGFRTKELAEQYVRKHQSTKSTPVGQRAAPDASTVAKAPSQASPKPARKKRASTQEATIKGPNKPPDKTNSTVPARPVEDTQAGQSKISKAPQKSAQLKRCSEPSFGAFVDRNSQSLSRSELNCRYWGSKTPPSCWPRAIRSYLLPELFPRRL